MPTDAEYAAFKKSEMARIADLHPGVKELLAAERRDSREVFYDHLDASQQDAFIEALDAERRATVERIEKRVDEITLEAVSVERVNGHLEVLASIQAILDEEAGL